ncbi:MAG: VanZ family protein [Bacteroidetes bacterium]|nr:VanZ family protein [Bacteroidota bacterium]MBS1632037.1 VanZ family protein [Bacteroidota bacterium]
MKSHPLSLFAGSLWLIISTILLTLPGSDLPKETWLNTIGFDKWVHIGMFALLSFLWCWVLSYRRRDPIRLKISFVQIALLSTAYGIIMELIQHFFVPGRSLDIADIMADAVGSFSGYFYSKWRYIKK